MSLTVYFNEDQLMEESTNGNLYTRKQQQIKLCYMSLLNQLLRTFTLTRTVLKIKSYLKNTVWKE